ncbi:MAG: hypothetical protein RLZZ414_2290 [Bacteroidota bacterium]|jgi:uncharacterized protein (TIGR02453 family)
MDYLKFLEQLKNNNSKEWMDENKVLFHQNRDAFWKDAEDILGFVKTLEPRMVNLELKNCIFRQNRDIRFSANKNPYKINFSEYYAIGGKKSILPGYYIHIEPNASFLAAGLWMPEKEVLRKVREEIDYSGDEFLNILNEPDFKKSFSELMDDQLKTAPKNYPKDHIYAQVLKYKSFIVQFPLKDSEIKNKSYIQTTKQKFQLAQNFVNYLTKAIEVEV